jgi:hypothetical protein
MRVGLAGCVVCRKREVHSGNWWQTLMERSHSEDQGVDDRIILKWILNVWKLRMWIGLIGIRMCTFG